MAKSTFDVEVIGWEKHNGSKKKNHRYFMLEYRFFEDSKISQLKQIECLLFIKCLCIAADLMVNRFQIHAGMMPKRWRIDDKTTENCLKTLQEFQLVRYEKNDSFPNTKQYNTKENNTKQSKVSKVSEKSVSLPAQPQQNLIPIYCELWKSRYGANPPIRPQDAKNLKAFVSNTGFDAAKQLLENYFLIPDAWFIKKRHDLVTFLNSLSIIAAFMESGKVVSNTELKALDRAVANNNTIAALERGEI